MQFVSVTRLRVRSIRFLPAFAIHAFRARRQVADAPGFQQGALLVDRRMTFWTLTFWDDQPSMRDYMGGGAHRAAMARLAHWCDEASVAHWEQPEPDLPSWLEADRRLRELGRPSRVRRPSPSHSAMTFASPMTRFTAQISRIRRPHGSARG